MALYNIYAGMTGDINNVDYRGTWDFKTYDDAIDKAYELAIEIYRSYEGYWGIKSWEDCANDLEGDSIVPFCTEEEIEAYYYEVIEQWIGYYAVLASNDPKRPLSQSIKIGDSNMNNSHIYVVTGIADIYPQDFLHPLGMARCVGYFTTLQEAENAIANDKILVKKFFFNWFFIEEMNPGVYQNVISRTCYHWNENINHYVKEPEPKCLKDYSNLGIG